MFQGWYEGVGWVFQWCYKGRYQVYWSCFKCASKFLAWGGGGQQCRRASYRLNCSLTNLVTDLPMVCKFKFVRYGHIKKKIVLFVPRFNCDGPLKSEVSHFFLIIFSFFLLNSSKSDLATDLQLVFKFKFVRYGHIRKKISSLCASVSFWRPFIYVLNPIPQGGGGQFDPHFFQCLSRPNGLT